MSNLLKRGNVYVFRRTVPARLRKILGAREIKRSLGTGSLEQARSRWLKVKAEVDRMFTEAEAGRQSPSVAAYKAIESWRATARDPDSPQEQGLDFWLTDRMEEGTDTEEHRALLRRHDHGGENNPPLSILFQRFYAERALTAKTKLEWQGALKRFIAVCGDMPVRSITVVNVRHFKDALLKSTGRTGTTLAPATAKKLLAAVSSVLKWGKRNGYLTSDPSDGITGSLAKKNHNDDRGVKVREQPVLVDGQRGHRLRILRAIGLGEPRQLARGRGPGLRVHDLVQRLLGPRLQAPRELVQDVGDPVHPAPLLRRLGPDVASRTLKARDGWRDPLSDPASAARIAFHEEPNKITHKKRGRRTTPLAFPNSRRSLVYSGMALFDTVYSVRRESHMGVYRIRSGSVGRPFTKGNPGGGRPKGAQNKATLEIKEFARNFLMSDRYRRTLERRILAGTAPQIEVLLHHYAFGKPTDKYVVPAPPARSDAELMSRMTKEEMREIYGLATRMREIRQAAAARSAAPPATAPRSEGPASAHGG